MVTLPLGNGLAPVSFICVDFGTATTPATATAMRPLASRPVSLAVTVRISFTRGEISPAASAIPLCIVLFLAQATDVPLKGGKPGILRQRLVGRVIS